MPIGAIIGAAGAVGGALISSRASRRASDAQTSAANRDIAFQRQTRDLIFDRLDPWYRGGRRANKALMYEMGLGDAPKNYDGFTATPSYNFRLEQGQDAVNALAGARGGLFSGRTLQDLTSFNQGLASQEYDNYLSRLGGLAGQGLGAASGQATAATNAAAGTSNALAGIGNAQAAGAIGQGNAWSGAINNGIGIWQYMQGQNGGANGGLTIGRPGSLFGGNSWG